MPFKCPVCHALHHDLPDVGVDRPDHYWRRSGKQAGTYAASKATAPL